MGMISTLRRKTRGDRGLFFREQIGALPRPLRVIDLGGTSKFWETLGFTAQDGLEVTLLNTHDIDTTMANYENTLPFITDLRGDAMKLTAKDLQAFALIFSNSFIEHLQDGMGSQRLMAQIITASGVPYFLQTPNKNSPVDPHFPRPYVPFFASYPRELQARLLTLGALGSGGKSGSLEEARERLRYYHPLGVRDVRALFPDATVKVERPLGVPMSILVYRL